ncbi:hypothetical protein TNCV_654531 [Trichonephila clavipes]|nr:hypothetical protein TNCV_654531 [Trichonephila clavipes]
MSLNIVTVTIIMFEHERKRLQYHTGDSTIWVRLTVRFTFYVASSSTNLSKEFTARWLLFLATRWLDGYSTGQCCMEYLHAALAIHDKTTALSSLAYAPDFTPWKFRIFLELARHMQSRRFLPADEINSASPFELKDRANNELQKCFDELY